MAAPLVTLTTDFGTGSTYVAAMKGALLAVNPAAHLVDLSHSVPPQDLLFCSFFLRSTLPFFPTGTLHVVVVDPGVGTDRAVLYVETGGQRLLAPDNGCWTALASLATDPPRVVRLTQQRYWRPSISPTFHGRDIFAPVAGHLSRGLDPQELGPPVTSWKELSWPAPRLAKDVLEGEVLFVDDFGNLLTNIPAEALEPWHGRVQSVDVGGHEVRRQVRTYGEADPGAIVALISSAGMLEVAVAHGSAARTLGASVGTPVRVELDGHVAAANS
jgi:S-adenosyl-L-methionine hydrolase (adenosine-forming)